MSLQQAAARFLILITTSAVFSGCTIENNPHDPFEKFNRNNHRFNQRLHRSLPINRCSQKKTNPILKRAHYFFANIGEVSSMANDVLQLKPKSLLVHFWRFVINSTIGIAGLFDVAGEIGLPHQPNKFSMTMAYYDQGKPSPYVVLPFIGPTTVRNIFAMPFDMILSPWSFIDIDNANAIRIPLKVITRGKKKYRVCNPKGDGYEAQKQAYLKHRREKIRQLKKRQ